VSGGTDIRPSQRHCAQPGWLGAKTPAPRFPNPATRVILAALVACASLAMPTASVGRDRLQVKFRWPAEGRIVAGFCNDPDDTGNHGINLAVSPRAEVYAAEDGRIAYAGNALKDFRNLILIRHDSGWVSAYAYSDEVLVKRGDIVRRGQVIARIGGPDPVGPPRLHFELRHDAVPVDPLVYLDADVTRATEERCGR
jgi:murein DD-endopeptidase MepM/ murein hydrolase activator NlpD